MFEETRFSNHDEATIRIIGKLCLEFPNLEKNLEEQLKIRQIIEETLYKYDVLTKETSLVVSDIEDKITMYLAVKKFECKSHKTLYNYKINLLQLADIFKKPISSINVGDIRNFLVYTTQGKKASTKDSKISILKSFFKWLVDEEYITKNPMNKISRPKVPKRLRHPMSPEEVELLKEACKTNREKALVEFLISSGCRLSEIVSVNKDHINWHEMSLYVIGKGDKERKVYFNAKAKILLLKYLETRKDNCEALFVTSRKPYKRLGGRSIEREIKKISKRTGLDKSIYPHLFRHTYATCKLNSGMPLPVLQELMGHEEASTTMIYSKLLEENIKHEYRKTT